MPASDRLPCWIFGSSKQAEMYLYLAREDGFDSLSEELKRRFGQPHLVMKLELHGGRRLARADVERVISELSERGYFLQLPPEIHPELYDADY